jgi:hypothetical protein
LAKRETTKESNSVDDAFDRLHKARLAFAKVVIKDDWRDNDYEVHPDEVWNAEEQYLAAYFNYLDALEKEEETSAAKRSDSKANA